MLVGYKGRSPSWDRKMREKSTRLFMVREQCFIISQMPMFASSYSPDRGNGVWLMQRAVVLRNTRIVI